MPKVDLTAAVLRRLPEIVRNPVLYGLTAYGLTVSFVEHQVLGFAWLDAWRDSWALAVASVVMLCWAKVLWTHRRRAPVRRFAPLAAPLLGFALAAASVAVWRGWTYRYDQHLGMLQQRRWRHTHTIPQTYQWTVVSVTGNPQPVVVAVSVLPSCPDTMIVHLRPEPADAVLEEVAPQLPTHREWRVAGLARPQAATFILTLSGVQGDGRQCFVHRVRSAR